MVLARCILETTGHEKGEHALRAIPMLTRNMRVDGLALFIDSGRCSTGFTSCVEVLLPPELFPRQLSCGYANVKL